jgi:hypothetical protein
LSGAGVLQQPSSADVLQAQQGLQTAPRAPWGSKWQAGRKAGWEQATVKLFVLQWLTSADVLQGQQGLLRAPTAPWTYHYKQAGRQNAIKQL